MRRTGLRLRITLLVVAYMLLLSLAVVYHGNVVNERAERLVWRSLLDSELDHYLRRRAEDPAYRWRDTDDVALYGEAGGVVAPPKLAGLHPGLHDELRIDGGQRVALVKDIEGRRLVLTLDITEFEAEERHLTTLMAGSALGGLALAGLLIAWGLRRLVKPLSDLARDIAALRPDRGGQRVAVGRQASAELVVISDAVNDYLARNERFVERERAFIDSTSHELRTPVAVIAGASELALGQPGAPEAVRNQLSRILRTARGVEQLVSLLLVLAKDPQRLAQASDRFALDQLLPEIVDDHRHLCADKDLELRVDAASACELVAPLAIVQAAIGNLLRNAIENSDRGVVTVALRPGGVVVIEDPGHGMTPEEISAIYARMARGGGGREGSGIGLDLIARLCEHLGWRLRIEPRAPRGTRVTLDLGPALAAA
ncbi:MAG TPA: HAMP domain-containing sensor histidine kinase [Luteimonas sp.]|nr:HAMP domain-containing sensor histidine kinase [Luteimonas sp.]